MALGFLGGGNLDAPFCYFRVRDETVAVERSVLLHCSSALGAILMYKPFSNPHFIQVSLPLDLKKLLQPLMMAQNIKVLVFDINVECRICMTHLRL